MFPPIRTPGDLAIAILALFGGVGLLIWLFSLALRWMDDRGWIILSNRTSMYRSVGNAVLEVQSALEPSKKHVLEMKRKETQKKIQADSGDPNHEPPA